ncbi:hypothetical protein ACSZOH_18560 [Aeromonas caviae]
MPFILKCITAIYLEMSIHDKATDINNQFSFLDLLFDCNDVADNTAPNTSPSLQPIHIVANPVST